MGFEQSQFENVDKTFTEFYLFLSPSLCVLEESSFKAATLWFKNAEILKFRFF